MKSIWYAHLALTRWEDVTDAIWDAVWFKKWMSLTEYYKQKLIELWSNTALFWVFMVVEMWLALPVWSSWVTFKEIEWYINHSFKTAVKQEYLKDVLKFWWIKVWLTASKIWMEASAFTLYQVQITPYEKAIIDTITNPKEWKAHIKAAENEVKEMSKPENLSQLMLYNTMFVTLLRLSSFASEYMVDLAWREKTSRVRELLSDIDKLDKLRHDEMSKLEEIMAPKLKKFLEEWILIDKKELDWFSKDLWDTKELIKIANIFVKPLIDGKYKFDITDTKLKYKNKNEEFYK